MARRRRKHFSPKRTTDRTSSPLYSLVGKKVKINRGGPNSKEGILLKAKKDYISLLAEQDVFYFLTEHIHSVTQNIKENSSISQTHTDVETFCSDSKTFSDLLKELKHKIIQINNGPESRVGKLLHANSAMLVLLNEEDGPIYYNLEHVKFIKTKFLSEEQETLQFNHGNVLNTDYSGFNTYADLMKQFNYKWVSVNRKGPEALEGVLMDEGCGFYTIVNNEETFRIHPFHIKSISVGAKGSFKVTKENNDGKHNEKKSRVDQSSESSYRESYLYEKSVEEVTWNPQKSIKTFDIYN